jgi:hypothetical protein
MAGIEQETEAVKAERTEKRRVAMEESRAFLREMSDREVDVICEVTQTQLSLALEEKARRMGVETPYLTIVVTDRPLVTAELPPPAPAGEVN